MDDQTLVRVLHRGTDLPEQRQPFGNSEVPLAAIIEQAFPFDQFHDEIGKAVLGRASVEDPCDVGMIQAGQDSSLAFEAPQDEIRIHPPADELQRGEPLEALVPADCPVNHTHPAMADLFEKLVGTRPAAHRESLPEVSGDRVFEKRLGAGE
jgi:hypothetical protein